MFVNNNKKDRVTACADQPSFQILFSLFHNYEVSKLLPVTLLLVCLYCMLTSEHCYIEVDGYCIQSPLNDSWANNSWHHVRLAIVKGVQSQMIWSSLVYSWLLVRTCKYKIVHTVRICITALCG